jgi:drug/metabolite transporter (DMT)-like permease
MSPNSVWRADLALAANAFIWGSTFVVVKRALDDASPLVFLSLRFAIAALALALIFRGRWNLERRLAASIGGGCVAGLCLFAGYAFQTAGLKYTSAAKSAFLTGTSIAMVPFLAAAVYRRRPELSEILGVLVVSAGMGLMTLEGQSLTLERGEWLTLLCAAGFAAHIVALGYYAKRVSFEVVAVMQVAVAGLLAGGTFWWMENPFLRWSAGVLVALVITGLLATALAFSVQAWAQQYTSATHTAVIFALEPIFAWLTSFLSTGETLSRQAALGAVLILAGIMMVELKPIKTSRHQSS